MRISDWSSDVCSSDLKDKFGDDHDGHGHDHSWPAPHGEAEGTPNLFRAELDDSSGTITFVTEFGSIPMQWSADGKAQAFRTGDTMTLALTGDHLGRASCREIVCQYF